MIYNFLSPIRQTLLANLSFPILTLRVLRQLGLFAGLIIIAVSLFFLRKYIIETISTSPLFISTNSENSAPANETELLGDSIYHVKVKKGDSLSTILASQNLPSKDINQIITLVKNADISKLKTDQIISFEYGINLVESEDSDLTKEQPVLNRVSFMVDNIRSIEFVRENEQFIINYVSAPLHRLVSKYETTVDTNVITSLQKVGLSTNSILKLIKAYSHQIDFQRQIKPGDKITVIAEKFVTDDNKFSHHGKIIYAAIKTKGNEYKIYHYSPTGEVNNLEFFSEEGQTIKSNLLRTPVKVARISSHYGYRSKHPVHGYGAMHKGVDFAAPTGTPIYAAGDGTVTFIGWKAGYGRLILIKHNNNITTAYAHASKFAKNLKKGSQVKQSDIIAYVGNSGSTTGSHLHFEVRVNDRQVNPMQFKSTPAVQLAGKKLVKFNKFKADIEELSSQLKSNIQLSANDFKAINF